MPPSICMVTEEAIPHFRRFCITQRSAELLSKDFDIHLVYIKSPIEEYSFDNIHTYPVDMKWDQFSTVNRIVAQLKLLKKTIHVCRKNKIDIVYGWWIPGYLASLMTGKKFVSDMPEFGEEMYRTFSFSLKRLFSAFLRRYQLWAAKYSKAVIVESDFAASIWEKRGIPKEKLHSAPYGVEVDVFAAAGSESVRKKYGIPQDAIMVLFYGDIGHDDGVDVLLKSIKSIDVWCVCAGDGPKKYMKYLKSIAGERTVFVGWVHYKEMPNLVMASDICVSPFVATRYTNTTFPLKVMEAMAAGKPVICSRLNALSTKVKDGYDIRLFESGDIAGLNKTISELASDKSLRERIGHNAKMTAINNFDWRRRSEIEKEIFKTLI